jgi:hypothetical protein
MGFYHYIPIYRLIAGVPHLAAKQGWNIPELNRGFTWKYIELNGIDQQQRGYKAKK